MKILFDFVSVEGGGGAEQSMGLLHAVVELYPRRVGDIICAVRSGSRLAETARLQGFTVVEIDSKLISRIWYSFFGGSRIVSDYNVKSVYVAFGIGIRVTSSCKQLVNVAYPIICYWESPYWKHLRPIDMLYRKLKSKVRGALIRRRAYRILVESGVMRRRMMSTMNLEANMISVLPPLKGDVARLLANSAFDRRPNKLEFSKILFVTGKDQHKNLWRLMGVASLLKERCIHGVQFQMTITEAEFLECCRRAGHFFPEHYESEYFEFLGRVFSEDLVECILQADVIGNISDLESVSNNFIEAFSAEKPMLISARDFSINSVRVPFSVCEPHDLESLYDGVIRCLNGDFDLPLDDSPLTSSRLERIETIFSMLDWAPTA